jgi:metallo-beta-lactamase class B
MSDRLLALLAASFLVVGSAAYAQTPLTGCPSSTINTLFDDFGRTGKMPPELGRWLNDPQAQITEPYQAFDNVYNVGICWVSAWLVKTSAGPVLIDSLYEPFTDQLIANLKKVGVDPADIKMVLLTHGHFDHVGGVAKLKALTNAKFVMSQEGWREAQANAQKSQGKPDAWTMPAATDMVVKDGDVLTVGDTRFYVFETPGDTWGTTSYALDVTDGVMTHRAITIGGLGLNAIDGAKQVEAYISSVDRIKAMVNAPSNPVSVHLTAHPFSNGLTENKERLKTRQPGQPHPLVDAQGLIKQLDELRAGATERLAVERSNVAVSPNTSAADIALATARGLAGDDPYLQITQALLCHEAGPDGKPVDAGPDEVNAVVPPTRIFDNLYYIGGTRTGSWLITTPAGYIMIDAMYGDSPETVTIPGMQALGLNPANIKYIAITHAGPDHAGGARYFQEKYGTRIVMSQRDWDGILRPQAGSWLLDDRPKAERPSQEREWVGPPAMDMVGEDGDTITLGGTTVRIFFTPRTANGGGLSFIVPVSDQGKPHVWATYGNTGAPASVEDRALHRASVQRFQRELELAKVDAITSSHPFVDGSNLRISTLMQRQPGMPNPFVIGSDATQRYVGILDQCTAVVEARNAAGLDENGTPR